MNGQRLVGIDTDDVEQSLLRMRLEPLVGDAVPTLLDLTELARTSAVADVAGFIDKARGHEPVDVAFVSGIVVHMPFGPDLVSRVEAEVVIDGVVIPLPH
jgi:hypothetical protein